MILALDISTKTGWARSDGKSGVFDLSEFDDYAEMGARLRGYLSAVLPLVTLCVIERPFIGSRNQYTTNGLVWTAHMTCFDREVERTEVGPATWRKALFGNGRLKRTEAKKRAIEWCNARGIVPRDDNHAEALCILRWAETCMKARAA